MRKIFLLTLVLSLILVFTIPAMFGEIQSQKKSQKGDRTEIITTNPDGTGVALEIEFQKGEAHNHPLMAVWVEDTAGKYIQTLYVAESIATGVFNYGDQSSGQWTEGEVRRPAALPYWSHQRGVKADDGLYLPTPENPVPDAYSGATPKSNFVIDTRMDKKGPEVFNVLFEINQPWDWNEYWTNNKYPDDEDYKSSAQPAVVYMATIDSNGSINEFTMRLIGHGHYSGDNGELVKDTATLTTALKIVDSIKVRVK
jgi:hypothetical protein